MAKRRRKSRRRREGAPPRTSRPRASNSANADPTHGMNQTAVSATERRDFAVTSTLQPGRKRELLVEAVRYSRRSAKTHAAPARRHPLPPRRHSREKPRRATKRERAQMAGRYALPSRGCFPTTGMLSGSATRHSTYVAIRYTAGCQRYRRRTPHAAWPITSAERPSQRSDVPGAASARSAASAEVQ